MTTTDIADFVSPDQIRVRVPVPDVLVQNNNPLPAAAGRQAAEARIDIAIDQANAGLMPDHVSRNSQAASAAPRNRNGFLRDRGDRALERSDEAHPGLPDNALTIRSVAASDNDYDAVPGTVLDLNVDLEGSFQEASSHNGFLS